ncbi:type III restriction enzyme [Xylariaceae sp. FL0804]|nr:type III restriction enzyme [Xylariaceae sp. FL0804]
MDSDEFNDDDIADEDLLVAATEATTPPCVQPSAKLSSYRFQPQNRHAPVRNNGFGPLQANSGLRGGPSHAAGQPSFIDLDNLPPNAFSSSPAGPRSGFRPAPPVGAPVASYRQTTLFGRPAQTNGEPAPAQPGGGPVFRADLPPEKATHHKLDREALKTWVYPTNMGPTRDYQFSIVKNGLFNNTLVALPTGLGKTFIAATIMLNYFRWMETAKLVFVAPTKPLVSQQVDACFHIAGIPRSQTTLLTGEVSPALRAEEWGAKRVFFMTPQTLENDLSRGYADPKSIGLLVVDEAHRATGNYSYVKVVSFMRRFSESFRILALTATPGSKVEAVQEVIDSLGISHVEIRTEESIDIRQFVHQRDEDIVLLDPSDEINHIKELFSKALKPLVDKLSQQNIYYGRDPMAITTYGLIKARQDWSARAGHSVNTGVKYMMMAIFSVLSSLAHSIKLLDFHGIRPFYQSVLQFRDETEDKGGKGSKWKRQVVEDRSFQEMMSKVDGWTKKDDFVSHPKLTCLADTILNHFMDAGEGRQGGSPSNTRIIVFSEYRDSAEDIVRTLNTHKPMIRAAVFVGQADSKRSEGMKQAEQIERIKKFKSGEFNVLVATSIGEEGLDIGQVDLIICFDASASPIRMLQRMGRTGRKRAGRVVLLLMRGKEEEKYAQSKDGYEKMQQLICEGSRFNFRHDLSARIVPREFRPEVDLRAVDIPIENTQISGLPEPKKGRQRKKKPPKKFHMPDDVETGFATVASMLGKKSGTAKSRAPRAPLEEDEVADIPELERVMLQNSQIEELNRVYKNLPYKYHDATEDIELRTRRKTVHLKHGAFTKRCVKLFQTLAKPYTVLQGKGYRQLALPREGSDTEAEAIEAGPVRKRRRLSSPADVESEEGGIGAAAASRTSAARPPSRKQQPVPRISHVLDDDDDDEVEEDTLPPPPRRRPATSRPRQQPGRKPPSAAKGPRGGRPTTKNKKKESRRGPRTTTAYYDESADEGDDCRRTSDLELSADDDDSGADLADFVVGDDAATSSAALASALTSSLRRSSLPPRSLSCSSSPTSQQSTPPAAVPAAAIAAGEKPGAPRRPYWVPTSFGASQDSVDGDLDDVPSMSQLVRDRAGGRAGHGSRAGIGGAEGEEEEEEDDGDDDDDDEVPVKRARRRGANKRRRLVLDEEDEDSDG